MFPTRVGKYHIPFAKIKEDLGEDIRQKSKSFSVIVNQFRTNIYLKKQFTRKGI